MGEARGGVNWESGARAPSPVGHYGIGAWGVEGVECCGGEGK